jgi:outer membrane protein OmpA-like peptidoglycan-associated protein
MKISDNSKMKKYIILILGMITTISISAQEQKHYFNLNAGGGLHNLKYDLQDGNVENGFGGTFNLGYSYFFKPSWAINTGVGLLSAQATGILNQVVSETSVDEDGDSYEFRTSYNNLEEKQTALFLDIPINLQYQHWVNEKWGLLATMGAKASIPLSANYKVTDGSVTTTGYYEQWNVELSDMTQHSFSTLTNQPSGDLNLKTSVSLNAELGALYNLSQRFDLYLGSYINIGVNNLINAGSNAVYPGDGTYNSMLASTQTSKVSLSTFGIKIGLCLRATHEKKVVYIAPAVQPIIDVIPVVEDLVVEEPVVQAVVPVINTSLVKKQIMVDTIIEPEPVVSLNDTILKTKVVAKQINIKFPLNSDVPLNDAFDKQFSELAQILKANPTLKIRIKGHTCNLASREYNLKVGMDRANVGKAMLLKLGVPESQILTESVAFDEPMVPNINEENRAKNRRIELIIE